MDLLGYGTRSTRTVSESTDIGIDLFIQLAHKTCDFKEESLSGMMSADLVSSFKMGQTRGCFYTYLHFASVQIDHFWEA